MVSGLWKIILVGLLNYFNKDWCPQNLCKSKKFIVY
jgi:hypothetical protein